MPDASHPLHFSLVRLRDINGAIVGAGFLVTPTLVCTCAHVVADALDISRETESPPEQDIHLDFPFLGDAKGTASIHTWVRMQPADGGGDIAILRLKTNPPAAARAARLLPTSPLSGKAFMTCGFPGTADMGQYAYGILRDQLANGYVQLEGTTKQGYRVRQGYSGTPVWDQRGRGVVGMIVAADRAEDTKVAFLIPNDHLFQACSELKPVTLHQLFAPLTNGLMGLPGSPLSGVERFFHTYLGTPKEPVPFGGRQEQLAALDQWLETPDHPYALLIEEAGRGKSALLAQWAATVADAQHADVVFVPISMRFGTSLRSTAISLLGARLRSVHNVQTDLPRSTEQWLAEIEMYLREDRSSSIPLLIVLDGADEAADWIVGQDLRFPLEPGNGVKVVVSARSLANCDAQGWLQRLEWSARETRMHLPPLNRMHVAEVLQSMENPLALLGTRFDVVGELHRLSEGDPLLIRLYVEALRATAEQSAFLKHEDLRLLTPGLQPYFDQWWNDQYRVWETLAPFKEKVVRTLFNLLACALGPLSIDDLLDLVEDDQVDSWVLTEALRPLARFVVSDSRGQGYVFSHPRLNQYFYEKLSQRERQAWEQRFLDYGRRTLAALTGSGQEKRKVSPYPIRYYGAHLERADAHPDRFDELICEHWQRAWEEREETYDGFLKDLMRAWRHAEVAWAQAQSNQERGKAISRQCRYTFIVSSINTLARNIPPTLLKELVVREVWTPFRGLSYARRIPDEARRAEALCGLAPHLPESLLQETLDAACAIVSEEYRMWAITELAPYLPESLLQEVLDTAYAIASEEYRAQALIRLAHHLPESLLQATLQTICTISNVDYRWLTLAVLAHHLPEALQQNVLQDALEGVRTMSNEDYRWLALVGLAHHLPESLQQNIIQEALEGIRTMSNETSRRLALAVLAPHLPEPLQQNVLQEALEDIRTTNDEFSQRMALAGLAPYLPESLLQEALEVAYSMNTYFRVNTLVELAPYLPESLLQETLEAIHASTTNSYEVAQALARLVPYLPTPLKQPVVQDALDAARSINNEYLQAEILAKLAPHLPTPLQQSVLQEALEIIRPIASADNQNLSWAIMAPFLPTSPLQYAVRKTPRLSSSLQKSVLQRRLKDINNEDYQILMLTKLATHVPELLQEAAAQEVLATVCTMNNEHDRAQALIGLAPYLPISLLQEVLLSTRFVIDKNLRVTLLVKLASYLPEPLLQEVLLKTHLITNKDLRATLLIRLAPYLPISLLQEVLLGTHFADNEDLKIKLLIKLAPNLPISLLQEVLATVHTTITDDYNLTQVLIGLIPYLSASLLQNALERARSITGNYARALVLTKLAPHLSQSIRDVITQEALEAAYAIPYRYAQVQILAELVPYLSKAHQEDIAQEVLEAMRTSIDEHSYTQILIKLTPYLSIPLLQEALEITRTSTNNYFRAEALVEISPYLPPSLQKLVKQEALATTCTIANDHVRAKLLIRLASNLPISLQQDVLNAARAIDSEDDRAWVLVELAPYLPEPLLQEALKVTGSFTDESKQLRALIGLAPCLPESLLQKALAVILAVNSEDDRVWVLVELAPYLPEPLLQEVLNTVHTIAGGKYLAWTLVELAPHLPESLLQEALAIARAIAFEHYRVWSIVSLAPYLPENLQQDILKATHAIASEDLRVLALIELAPHLPESFLQEALEIARGMIREDKRAQALAGLALHLEYHSIVELYSLWCEILHVLASRTRPELLEDIRVLAPIIEILGGKEALTQIAVDVIEVRKWFP